MAKDNKKVTEKLKLPDNAVLVKQMGALEFYFSKTKHAFFVSVSDYHAGSIQLSRNDLVELLNIFDKQTAEKETALMSDLGNEDDDFV